MNRTAGLMKAGTLKCIHSSVCHSYIISLQAAAAGFHAAFVSAASPQGSKLQSTLNSRLADTLHWFYSREEIHFKVIKKKKRRTQTATGVTNINPVSVWQSCFLSAGIIPGPIHLSYKSTPHHVLFMSVSWIYVLCVCDTYKSQGILGGSVLLMLEAFWGLGSEEVSAYLRGGNRSDVR